MMYDIMNEMSPLVCIFPMGGGKMILIMISAMINEDKMMIVVISYIALTDDLKKECKSAKISCLRWTSGTMQRATIMMIVSDTEDIRGIPDIHTRSIQRRQIVKSIL